MRLRLPRPRLPRLRDILSFLISLVIALIGAVGVILFFESRDEAQLEAGREEPGRVYRGEPVLSPGLQEAVDQGNVIVLHRDARLPPGSKELAEGAGPRLRELGLAVIFETEPTLRTPLAAVADDRIEYGNVPADLRNFVDFHLGP